MRIEDLQAIVDRYEERLREHGASVAALASGNVERQRLRFGVLADVGDLRGKRVLDLGCGLGDFYGYLRDQGIDCDYTGYDITPGFIARARDRFPNARFEVRDIQSRMPGQRFDYAVCSQVFNNRLSGDDNVEVVTDIMDRLQSLAGEGVAIDMVTSHVDFRQDHLFYFDPGDMFARAKRLTRRVVLRHDYPLFEFCLYLYPTFQGWGRGA